MRGVIAVLMACACGSSVRESPAPGAAVKWPAQRWQAARTTLTFAEPAARYNEPLRAPEHNALTTKLVAEIKASAKAAGRAIPEEDERLFLAMAGLAAVMPYDSTLPYSFIEFALHTNGVIETSPHMLVAWGDVVERTEALVAELRPAFDRTFKEGEAPRIGIGLSARNGSTNGVVVVALQGSPVQTNPIPRRLAVDESATLEVKVPAATRANVLVLRPSGHVDLPPLVTSGDTVTAQLDCGGSTGKMFVEVVMDGQESRAKFPIWCGLEPPRTLVLDAPGEAHLDVDAAERELVVRINRDRAAMMLPPLAWNEKLARAARNHSEAMRTEHNVSTTLASGTLKQRLVVNYGLGPTMGGVARAYGVGEVHRGLTELPSTRGPFVIPNATQIGVGVAYGEELFEGLREMYVTTVVAPD